MIRSRLLWKLYASYVALILMAVLVVGLLHGRQIDKDLQTETEKRLHSNALMLRVIARPVLRAGEYDAEFQSRIARLGQETRTRFTLIAEDGSVLADSDEDPFTMGNHGDRKEIRGARDTQREAVVERYSATLKQDMVYVAVPVNENDYTLGYVRTAQARADLTAYTSNLQTSMAIGALIVAAIGCLVGFVVARRLTGRLHTMTEVAESMADGEHHLRVAPMGNDEVGKLARAFNAMAEQLESRIETIGRERAELLAILKSMVEGVLAVDRSQNVVLINDEARRILDASETDVTGRPVWEITRVQAACDILDLVLRGAVEARDEVTLPMRSGDRSLELHATQLLDDQQEVAGAIVVLHDITGLRHLENVRRDFVTNVSHELKTPLTAIRGFVETLLDDEEMNPKTRRRFLSKISDHSDRLTTLVTDLLALSRVEAQGVRPDRETLDLREPVRASAGLLIAPAEKSGVTLRLHLPDRSVPVVGDPEMLRQVVDNLLDNAIKYTPAGGTVDLRVSQRGDLAVLEVEDTGVGLEPQHRDRIFERFYRVDRARSRELGGTGLGLSIVRHVVLAHHGLVSVDSAPGQGSTFRVELPIAGVDLPRDPIPKVMT